MRYALALIVAALATPAGAQISNPTIADSGAAETAAQAKATADAAAQAAADAQAAAQAAQTSAAGAVRSINGAGPNASGAVSLAIPTAPDLSNYATTSAVQSAISSATAGVVKSVNSTTPNASGAVSLAIPTPSTTTPPSVADASATGTMTTVYALANHTHASKARKGRVVVPTTGFFDVTFGTPFTAGVAPLCAVVAETTAGDTNVVNAQIDGATTSTGLRIRITRTAITVASLLGLNILSVPAQIATAAHYICIEP